jgi:hypothetical protein
MANLLLTLGVKKSLMDPKSFDNTMRELEYFHSLRLLPGAWAIIRVDGRSFRDSQNPDSRNPLISNFTS